MRLPSRPRTARPVAALLLAALVLLTGCGADPGAAALREDRRPGTLQLGVTVFAMWRDWDRVDELLDRAADAGSPWLRVDVGWCSLEERGPGQISQWYQDRLDHVVDGAQARGLQVLLSVDCAPGWAGGERYPDNPGEFFRVTRYLAERYRGRVAAWEIGNEPDCVGGCPNGSPQEYVPVLQAGYRGVKAGDPDATVVSAGVSGVNADWLERMYQAGAGGWFDVLAVHPYLDPPTAPPDAPENGGVYRLTALPEVRDVMVRHGDAGKPIWFTEWGWTTASDGERPGVDERTQAEYLRRTVELVQARYPWVTHAFWFTMRDRDDWTPYENEFGLLHVDGSEKPAYSAFRDAVEWLG